MVQRSSLYIVGTVALLSFAMSACTQQSASKGQKGGGGGGRGRGGGGQVVNVQAAARS